MTLLRGKWLSENDDGRWWAFRCDGCGNERAMRAPTVREAVAGLGLKTTAIALDEKKTLEHYCRRCQRKGA